MFNVTAEQSAARQEELVVAAAAVVAVVVEVTNPAALAVVEEAHTLDTNLGRSSSQLRISNRPKKKEMCEKEL